LNKETIKYEVDPYNKLAISKTCKTSNLPKFRQILEGRFKIDKKITLPI